MKHILVADDDSDIRELVGEFLYAKGFRATTAPDGETAKSLLSEDDFDLLITDLDMPGINGLVLLDWVHTSRPNMPTIICSGSVSPDEGFIAERADAFVAKPFTAEELLNTVNMLTA